MVWLRHRLQPEWPTIRGRKRISEGFVWVLLDQMEEYKRKNLSLYRFLFDVPFGIWTLRTGSLGLDGVSDAMVGGRSRLNSFNEGFVNNSCVVLSFLWRRFWRWWSWVCFLSVLTRSSTGSKPKMFTYLFTPPSDPRVSKTVSQKQIIQNVPAHYDKHNSHSVDR